MASALKRSFPKNFKGYALLALIWLFSGFALGAAILLGPLRTWVNYARAHEFSSTVESLVVMVFILLLVVISFILSLKIYKWHRLSAKKLSGKLVLAIPALMAAIALWLFMNPQIINRGETSESVSSKFTVGPYPTEDKMKQLKEEGYTTIVSLLHPAVVPFEPSLLKDEEAATAKYGLTLVKAPMLPWIGDNEASLDSIKNIILNGKGKYYFHCYLGKDRVNVVKNLIVNLTGKVDEVNTESRRSFETQGSFERGEIYKIDSAVYMSPFPTDEEVLAFFLAGNVKSVINLMDSTDEEAKPWIEKEAKALQSMNINYSIINVPEDAKDKDIVMVLDSIEHLPKPLVVHHWNTTCPQSILFRKNYYLKTKFVQINLATKDAATY